MRESESIGMYFNNYIRDVYAYEEIVPDFLISNRYIKLAAIKALNLDPWGHRFDDHASISCVRLLPPAPSGNATDGPFVRIAGRIALRRAQGKVVFLELRDWSERIQIFVGKSQVGEQSWKLADFLDLGDILGVDGNLGFTRTGELTVFASKLTLLCKSLLPPPEKFHGLTDPEKRSRRRYVDLASNPESMQTFLGRSKIVAAFHRTSWEIAGFRGRRDADDAADRRRGGGPAIRHASQYVGPGIVPADRAGVVLSSDCSSGGWSGSTRLAGCIVTRGSAASTTLSSRCWRRIRHMATTAR